MDVAIVTLLSVVLAALLAMPWWIFRMMDSLRKELTGKIEESDAKTAAKFADLEAKLTDLETRTDAKLADLETRTDAKFADLEAKLTARIDRLEAGFNIRFTEFETQLNGLRSDITKLSERVARIEGYLFGIEPPAPDGPGPVGGTDRPAPPPVA